MLNSPDVDLLQVNEAFAAQVIPSADQLGIGWERLSVKGAESHWGTRSA